MCENVTYFFYDQVKEFYFDEQIICLYFCVSFLSKLAHINMNRNRFQFNLISEGTMIPPDELSRKLAISIVNGYPGGLLFFKLYLSIL